MDIDDVFTRIGDFGSAQKKIFHILCTCQIFLGCHALVLTFIGAAPDWGCEDGKDTGAHDKCTMFEQKHCSPLYSTEFSSIVSEVLIDSTLVLYTHTHHTHVHPHTPHTLTQWDLLCSKSSWPNMSQSVFFVGSLIGAWVWGIIADKIGRKKVFFITLLCTVASGLGFGLAFSYTVFVFFRLLSAVSCAGVILTSYVLSVEIVGITARSYAGIVGAVFFSMAYPFLALLAYFIRSWRWLCVVISLLGLGYFPLWRCVDMYVHVCVVYLYSPCYGNKTCMSTLYTTTPTAGFRVSCRIFV